MIDCFANWWVFSSTILTLCWWITVREVIKVCHQVNTIVSPSVSFHTLKCLFVSNFENYITLKYGQDTWNKIKKLSSIDSSNFVMHQVYPDQLIVNWLKLLFKFLESKNQIYTKKRGTISSNTLVNLDMTKYWSFLEEN